MWLCNNCGNRNNGNNCETCLINRPSYDLMKSFFNQNHINNGLLNSSNEITVTSNDHGKMPLTASVPQPVLAEVIKTPSRKWEIFCTIMKFIGKVIFYTVYSVIAIAAAIMEGLLSASGNHKHHHHRSRKH